MIDCMILLLIGFDCVLFFQGLVSNDVFKLNGGIVYVVLFILQGKYLVDFFVVDCGDDLLIDVVVFFVLMLF